MIRSTQTSENYALQQECPRSTVGAALNRLDRISDHLAPAPLSMEVGLDTSISCALAKPSENGVRSTGSNRPRRSPSVAASERIARIKDHLDPQQAPNPNQTEIEMASANASATRNPVTGLPPAFQIARTCLATLDHVSPRAAGQAALLLCSTPICAKPRSNERRILARATESRFQAAGYSINSYSWGTGPVVLLAHGWGVSAASMTSFVDPLLSKGYRVIAVDAPAHGKSSGWTSDMVAFSKALSHLAIIHKPTAIVGHSFGAVSTLLALEEQPDLQPKLVFLSSQGDAASSVIRMGEALGLGREGLAALSASLVSRVGRPLEEFRASNTGRSRRAPALVVHDLKDTLIPIADGRDMAASLENSSLLEVSGVGHNKVLRHPETLASIVDFIGEAAPTATAVNHH